MKVSYLCQASFSTPCRWACWPWSSRELRSYSSVKTASCRRTTGSETWITNNAACKCVTALCIYYAQYECVAQLMWVNHELKGRLKKSVDKRSCIILLQRKSHVSINEGQIILLNKTEHFTCLSYCKYWIFWWSTPSKMITSAQK